MKTKGIYMGVVMVLLLAGGGAEAYHGIELGQKTPGSDTAISESRVQIPPRQFAEPATAVQPQEIYLGEVIPENDATIEETTVLLPESRFTGVAAEQAPQFYLGEEVALNSEPGDLRETAAAAIQPVEEVASVDTILHKAIRNKAGEKLGRVADVIVDQEDGQIAYLIVSSGGWLGIGTQKLAVPYGAVYHNDEGALVLDIGRQQFKNAPTRQENMADRNWGRKVHEFFGIAPYWESAPRY